MLSFETIECVIGQMKMENEWGKKERRVVKNEMQRKND